jgi:hypothetical protein
MRPPLRVRLNRVAVYTMNYGHRAEERLREFPTACDVDLRALAEAGF